MSLAKAVTRILSKTKKIKGCLIYQGYLNIEGRARVSYLGKSRNAARLIAAHFLKLNIDDRKTCVCHTCDNPACLNVEHLYLGNQSTNTLDCFRRLRRKPNRQKFSNEKIIALRKELRTGDVKEIAKREGVEIVCIRNIKLRKTYRYL